MRARRIALAAAALLAACGCNDGGSPHVLPDASLTGHPAADAPPASDAAVPADAAPEPDAVVMPKVIFPASGARVTVTLARTSEEQRRGLMYVQHMPVDAGMLFLFRRDAVQSFWMRNTLIPLDMIFIRADMTVAGIVENAAPLTDTPRGVDAVSRYVLEVNGGWSAAHGIQKDAQVQFEGFTP